MTAVTVVPVLVAVVFVGPHALGPMMIVIGGIAGFELARMVRANLGVTLLLVATPATICGASYAGVLLADLTATPVLLLLLLCALFWMLVWGAVLVFLRSKQYALMAVASIFYGYCFAYVVQLSVLPNGWQWVVLAAGIPVVADTAAYFIGRKFGRHKLVTTISPNKTVEGLIGGFAAATVVATIYLQFTTLNVGLYLFPLIGLGQAVAGITGDLYESLLKRLAGVKDSGAILPGHGGLLDRLDSVAPSLPLVFLLVLALGV